MPEILFEDLDATDRRIVQLAEDIGYVTLSEVVRATAPRCWGASNSRRRRSRHF